MEININITITEESGVDCKKPLDIKTALGDLDKLDGMISDAAKKIADTLMSKPDRDNRDIFDYFFSKTSPKEDKGTEAGKLHTAFDVLENITKKQDDFNAAPKESRLESLEKQLREISLSLMRLERLHPMGGGEGATPQ